LDSKEFPIRKNDLIAGRYQVGVGRAADGHLGCSEGQGSCSTEERGSRQ
jgi:hypothetical protein